MAGISSKAAGTTENKKKYQQYELNGRGATFMWSQPPSRPDINTARGTEYVFGMGSGRIYVYDRNGVKATLPLNTQFKK